MKMFLDSLALPLRAALAILLLAGNLAAAERYGDERAAVWGRGSEDGSVAELWEKVQRLKGNARRGRGYYEQDCLSCHGPRGGADGPLAGQLPGQMIRFDDRSAMVQRSDKDLFYDVTMGRDASAMPGFYPGYRPQELKDLLAYLRALQERKKVPLSRARRDQNAYIRRMAEKSLRIGSKAHNEALKRPKPAWALTPRPAPHALSGTARP